MGSKSQAARGKVGASVSATRGRRPVGIGAAGRVDGVYEFCAYAPMRIRSVGKFTSMVERFAEKIADEGVLGFMLHHARKSQIVSAGHHAKLLEFASAALDLVTCPTPELLWRKLAHNRIVNTGLDDILDKYFKGSTYTAAHYLGLTDGTPTVAAGDTMGSHAGWAEVTGYSESNRQTITFGTVSGQSVDNSGSKAVITASGSITVGGGFCTTDNTKGGVGGTLISAAALDGGDEVLTTSETLTLTYTASLADDGV